MGFFDRYPYTNWHNVNLDWVLERVKEWGELVEANDQAFKDLQEANESFKEYVTNYIQNLDVQEEINNKLNEMLESGVLTEHFLPFISLDVSNWLNENITEPEGVVIDQSLTVEGACADSFTVGRNFDVVNTTIQNLPNNIFSDRAKNSLLELLRHIGVWDNELAQVYYNNLRNALTGNITDWDLEWNYTDGMPDVKGLELVNDGTGNSTAMTINGLLLTTASTSGNQLRIRYRLDTQRILYKRVIFESTFLINAYGESAMQDNTYGYGVRFYNGLGYNTDNIPRSHPGGQLVFKGRYILFRNSTPAWEILSGVSPLSTDTFYTVRIDLEYGYGATFYINGEIIKTIQWDNLTELINNPQIALTHGVIATIKDFKLKFYN